MKKVFLDTNIILDVMAQRQPFNVPANAIMKLGIEGKISLCATPLTFANCVYILKSSYNTSSPINIVKAYKQYIFALTMDDEQCCNALCGDMPDFEDMLQYQAAIAAGCDYIVTRNERHFPKETIPVVNSERFLSIFDQEVRQQESV